MTVGLPLSFAAAVAMGLPGLQVANLKTDFGAAGDDATDDSDKLQLAFDTCFGSFVSPHTSPTQNIPLFVPSGKYIISKPVYLTGVGPWIFGEGFSTFRYITDGTTETITGENSLSMIVADGLSYAVFENINFDRPTFEIGPGSIGFYLTQTGSRGISGYNTFTGPGGITFFDVGFKIKATHGCAGNVFNDMTFGGNNLSGLYIDCPESINNMVLGGGAAQCAAIGTCRPDSSDPGNRGAGYTIMDGGISMMTNLSMDQTEQWYVTDTASGAGGAIELTVRPNSIGQSPSSFPLRDGCIVKVFGVGGTTNANGIWTVTVTGLPTGQILLNGSTWNAPFDSSTSNADNASPGAGSVLNAAAWDFVHNGSILHIASGSAEGNQNICTTNDNSTVLVKNYTTRSSFPDNLSFYDAQLGGLFIAQSTQFGAANRFSAGPASNVYLSKLGSKGRLILDNTYVGSEFTNTVYSLTGSAGSSLYIRSGQWPNVHLYGNLGTTFTGSLNENIPDDVF